MRFVGESRPRRCSAAPETEANAHAWTARVWRARLVCVLTAVAPVLTGATAAIELSGRLPASSSLLGTLLRVLFVVVASTAVVFAVDRAARRFLPLAALYRLSLVFPDRAPSRFRTALKAGSSRSVERMLAETRRAGLPADANEAARRVVQLIAAIGDHDRRTRGHSERVRLYADLIGEELHLSKQERQKLQWAALLHDLGKLSVPGEILNKKGAPSADEWAILRTHPAAGERLVAPLRPFLGSWADAVGGHHEWWNGTGYPRQLRGDQISQSAAIVAVADAYEVMTAVRSYKKSMPASAARAELTRAAGVQFSPEVVRALLCVSLGKLRLAAGPVASLAQIPYLGSAVRFPATVGTAIQGATSVAAAAVPSVAAGVVVATTAVAASIAVTPPKIAHRAPVFAEAVSHTSGRTTSPVTTRGATPTREVEPTPGAAIKDAGTVTGDDPPKSSGPAPTTPAGSANSAAAPAISDGGGATTSSGNDGATPADTTPPAVDPSPDDSTANNPPVVTPPVVPDVSVSIGDASIPEGDTGTRTLAFPITLSKPATTAVTVRFDVTGVTATGTSSESGESGESAAPKAKSGADFKLKSGTVTFGMGSSGTTTVAKAIGVTIAGDTIVEPDETLTVTLSAPNGATLGRAVATGTILNDDGITAGVTIGIGDGSIVQAATDTRVIGFAVPVWLSAPADSDVQVSYTIDDGTATWSDKAIGGGDYGGARSGVLDFAPGCVVQRIPVKIWPNAQPGPERSFTITLTPVDGSATLVRSVGTVTIDRL